MIANSMTKMRWFQMISVKDCSKIVNGSLCPCADKLRKVTLRIPINAYDEKECEKDILKYQIKYNKCFMKKDYPY